MHAYSHPDGPKHSPYSLKPPLSHHLYHFYHLIHYHASSTTMTPALPLHPLHHPTPPNRRESEQSVKSIAIVRVSQCVFVNTTSHPVHCTPHPVHPDFVVCMKMTIRPGLLAGMLRVKMIRTIIILENENILCFVCYFC